MASLGHGSLIGLVFSMQLMSLAGGPPRATAATPVQAAVEYKVKAAYLLNFTRYIEWPKGAFTTPDAPVAICILGVDPFGPVLEKTMAGRVSNGRRIEVLRLREIDDRLLSCHLVFISQTEATPEAAVLDKLRDHPILTVGESKNFLMSGGMINLIIVNAHVHFEINTAATARAGLKISSRMLPLAKRVISDGG